MNDVWTPPTAPLEGANSTDRAYATDVRQRHITHETSIKSIGTLYYFVASMMILGAAAALFGTRNFGMRAVIVGVAVAGVSALLIWLGRGVKQLKSWAKIPVGILSGIGLIGFPVWTLINGYILYLLFSEKGTMVFSDEYKQVIADTPEIKSRTSIIVWIVLILLLAAIASGVIGRVLGH